MPGRPLKISIGVDLGGTWLRAAMVDRRGRELRRVRRPAPPPQKLPSTLRHLWKEWKLARPDQLIVGSKGVWTQDKRRAMARALAGLAARVTVISDVELAYAAVLGSRPGVLILAGTGSIALARDRRGLWRRAGGLGPEKGDEGSGYWIGREYERRMLGRRRAFSPGAVRATAALAGRVLNGARRDRHCALILEEAAGHLAALAGQAAKAAGLKGKTRAGWWGGLMAFPSFRRRVYRKLKGFTPLSPRLPAERVAALLGAGKYGKMAPL